MSYLIIPYLLILFSANLLGSLAGFGGGMISIPLLVLLMDPKAVIVSSTMTCILNGIIALQHRKEILWREFALILGGMCLGCRWACWPSPSCRCGCSRARWAC